MGGPFRGPVRKVFYNITITGLSVFVAFFIGTVEVLGLVSSEMNLNGGFWRFMKGFNINSAGFFVLGLFVVTWVVALSVWRLGRVEARSGRGRVAGPSGAGGRWRHAYNQER